MKIIEIKSRWTGKVLHRGEEGESLRDLVIRKVAEGANLRYADLSYANLRYANLRYANLRYADLSDANLSGADLSDANLSGANLRYADLSDANLRGADLSDANLPSPTAVLLACWPDLSPQLVADLMLFDAENHPDPAAFDKWAAGGGCPYSGVRVQRAANFTEDKTLWGKGVYCRPYDLMVRVLAEACPEWTDKQRASFEKKFSEAKKK
jgi:uncharacterized protein YjbI with pentapeptide repeats